MQFTSAFLAALSASAVLANTIRFNNVDSTERTIYFTPNSGLAAIPKITIPGNSNAVANFPNAWIGNFFSISKGAAYKPGMLGEVNFNSWGGKTFFDVSAIVDPNDTNGVHWMYPAASKSPKSGCDTFPCNNVYNIWDDVQTKVTEETDLVCILGGPTASAARRHARDFVAKVRHALVSDEVAAQTDFPRNFITASA